MDEINGDRRVLLAGLGIAVAGSLLAATTAQAGDLEPPPGGVVPTKKKLAELDKKIARTDDGIAEPRTPVQSLPGSVTAQYVISAPGSYYLNDNILGVAGKQAIEIRADHVDLDLGGFQMIGVAGSLSGITTDRENVTVYNGTLIGWGVALDFGDATRFILWDLTSIGAGADAISVGSHGQVYDCDAYGAGESGFKMKAAAIKSVMEECGAWQCSVGFTCLGSRNLFLANCATDNGTAFEIGAGNSFGPIVDVVGVGDISAVPGADHPGANFVY
jgi:hypothetical protein